MESVHGISVAGTFPAEIWRRFMQPALQYSRLATLHCRRTGRSGATSTRGRIRTPPATATPTPTPTTRTTRRRRARRRHHRRRPLSRLRLRLRRRRHHPPPRLSRRPNRRRCRLLPSRCRLRRRRSRPLRRSEARRAGGRSRRTRARRALRRARVAGGLAARPAQRRPPRGRYRLRVGVPRGARDGVRPLHARSACAGSARGATQDCRGSCGRDPSRPARRAAPPFHRRLDVLELRPDRRRSRRQSLPRSPERVPRRPVVSLRRSGLA